MLREWTTAFWLRLRSLVKRRQLDLDLEDEMRFHLEMRAKKLADSGVPAEEAHHAAQRQFGNLMRLKETSREMWGFRALETLLLDIRYGLRQLRRNPGFTAVAIITLALGIGANTAIFSVIDAVILHPSLPYRDQDQLMNVHQIAGTSANSTYLFFTPGDFLALEAQNDVFDGIAATKYGGANVTGGAQPMRVYDVTATPSLFSVLGTKPLLGRTLGPADIAHGASDAVVLGNHLWQEAFGGRRDVIGKTIQVNGKSCVVVGVMPARFYDPALYSGTYMLWQPLVFTSKERADHSTRRLTVFARLKPGITVAQAQAELKTLGERFQKISPQADKNVNIAAWRLAKPPYLWDYMRPLFVPLYAAAIFVLIIGCVNLANLLLTRGAAREHEIAVRAALGAAPRRLMRQFMTEGVLLSILGGGAGILLAFWGIDLFKVLIPPGWLSSNIRDARIDLRVLIFALVVAVIAGVLFSIIPALRISKVDPHESLKEGGRAAISAAGAQRVRNTLLVAEAALALVLLFGAGVVFHAFTELLNTDPGFDLHHVLAFNVGLDNTHYPDKSTWAPFFERLTEHLKPLPGVTSVAAAQGAAAVNLWGTFVYIQIPGMPPFRNPFEREANYNPISPSYFQTLHIPLEKGRYFTLTDDAASPPVAIVSDTVASRYFHNENLVGKMIEVSVIYGAHWTKSLKVVGVVHGVRQYSLSQPEIPMIYVPQRQDPSQLMTVVLRTGPPPESMIPAVRRRVAEVMTTQPAFGITTIKKRYEESTSFQHMDVDLFGGFALITLLLAAVGIYGVAAYGVSQRFHEIGIRMALGATRGQILKMVVKQALSWVLLGIGIGCVLLLPFERLLAAMLGNSHGSHMPSTMTIHANASLLVIVLISLAVLLAAAIIASLVPARRAANVDPMEALRYE